MKYNEVHQTRWVVQSQVCQLSSASQTPVKNSRRSLAGVGGGGGGGVIVCAKFKTKTRSLLFVENEHSLIRYSLHPLFDVDRIMKYESIWSLNFKNSTTINYTLGLQKITTSFEEEFR